MPASAICSSGSDATTRRERQYALAEAGWRSDAPEPKNLARFLADHDRKVEEAVAIAEAAAADRHDIFTDGCAGVGVLQGGPPGRRQERHREGASHRDARRDIRAHAAAIRRRRHGAGLEVTLAMKRYGPAPLCRLPRAGRLHGGRGRRPRDRHDAGVGSIRDGTYTIDIAVDPDALLTKLEVFGGAPLSDAGISRAERDRRIEALATAFLERVVVRFDGVERPRFAYLPASALNDTRKALDRAADRPGARRARRR